MFERTRYVGGKLLPYFATAITAKLLTASDYGKGKLFFANIAAYNYVLDTILQADMHTYEKVPNLVPSRSTEVVFGKSCTNNFTPQTRIGATSESFENNKTWHQNAEAAKTCFPSRNESSLPPF